MNTLTFKVNGNRMKLVSGYKPVSGEKKYTQLKFILDDEWKGVESILVSQYFDVTDAPEPVHAEVNNGIAVANIHENLRNQSGTLHIGIIGAVADGSNVTIDTNIVHVPVGDGTHLNGTESTALIQQFLTYLAKIESEMRKKVKTEDIENGAVTTEKIAESAVTGDKIADNSVDNHHIKNGVVTDDKLAGGAVTSDKISGGAVSTDKLADGAVTESKLSEKYWKCYSRIPAFSYADLDHLFSNDVYTLFCLNVAGLGELSVVGAGYYLGAILGGNSLLIINVSNGEMWTYVKGSGEVNKVTPPGAELSPEKIGAKIISGEIKSIVLIGDSITDGFGGTAYNGNAKNALSTNTEGYCWANLFKKFVEERYNIPVVNRGMWGTQMLFQKTEAEKFITKNDFVIWLSGTNNRNSQSAFEDYQNNMLSYVDAIKKKCGGMLFISNIPSTISNETDHYATMQQIDEVAFSKVYGKVPFVSLYREFIKYCKMHNISLFDVFYDHVHPNDTGYLIIFKLICDILGLPLDPYKDYSYSGDWWGGRLVLDTGLYDTGKPFDSWTNKIVPVIQMAQYDAQSNTTLFSGKTLRKVRVAGMGFSAGSLTIGTVALNTLSSSLNVVNKVVVNVDEDGLIDFGEEGFSIPENHTLAIGDVSDTTRLSFVSGTMGLVSTENYMYTSDHWLKSTPPAPYIRLVAAFYFQ